MSSKVIVTIFGASGDLAQRKLYPSLFRLYKSGNLSEHFAVIGTARRPWSKEYFESVVVESISDLADSPEQAQEFASHFYYQSHDVQDTEHYIELCKLQNKNGFSVWRRSKWYFNVCSYVYLWIFIYPTLGNESGITTCCWDKLRSKVV